MGNIKDRSIKLKLTTLSPVHIGSGRVLSYNTEYLNFPKEGVCAVIDEQKVLEIIGHENIDKWVALIDNQEDLLDYLKRRKPDLKPEDVAKRIIQGKVPQNNRQGLREQMFTGNGRPLLPGSSLKGSIRTAYLNERLREKYKQPGHTIPDNQLLFKNEKTGQQFLNYKANQKLQQQILGPNPNKDIFRHLQVGDAMPDCTTEVTPGLLMNHKGKYGWCQDDTSMHLMEVIPKNTSVTIDIKIWKHVDTGITPFSSINELFADLNNTAFISLDMDRQGLENAPNEIAEALFDKYGEWQDFIDKAEDSREGYMRVGMGSGWLFMTGGWPVDKQDEESQIVKSEIQPMIRKKVQGKHLPDDLPFPKTRKLLEGGTPLGFVKLEKVD